MTKKLTRAELEAVIREAVARIEHGQTSGGVDLLRQHVTCPPAIELRDIRDDAT